jgi:hypothetical protein
LLDSRDEVPPPPGVLAIIQQILPYNPDSRVGEEGMEESDNTDFFVQVPISVPSLPAHERDADCIKISPADSCASNMSCTSFEIEGESKTLRLKVGSANQEPKDIFNLTEIRPEDESAFWGRIRNSVSEPCGTAKVVDRNSSPTPLAENCCWMVGGDALSGRGGRIKVGVKHGAAPLGDSPSAGERPHARVTHCDNDRRIDKGDLLF